MPVSKKRKKKGKSVEHSAARRIQRLEEAPTGVTLQDLINVLAYQEYVADGTIVPESSADAEPTEVVDFEDPTTQAVIKAVSETKVKEQD